MSVYPRNLSAFLNRLSGYNKNNIKMNVLGSDTANGGDTIQVDLPTNSIVDLSSLAWAFTQTIAAPGGGGNATLPTQAESVIDRLAVEVNGQTLVNLQNYNVLFHSLLYTTATEDYQRQRIVGQSTSTAALMAYNAAAPVVREHVIDSWLGFLGSSKPSFIDTSLLGNVRITITLANPSQIIGSGNAAMDAGRAYTISDQHFSMDVVSISDGIYDAMMDQMLASGAPIEIPFKNYFSYTQTLQDGTRNVMFNVASQSIDRLWATARLSTYAGANTGAGVVVAGPQFPVGALCPSAFNFIKDATGYQFQVNNTLYPNWSSTKAVDWWQHTKLAVGDQGNMLAGSFPTDMTQYLDNFFVYACQLEHHSDGDERFVSGIDTRGAAATCFFKSTNAGGAPNQTLVFAECTSSLKVYANKVLEVVQ